MDFDLDAYLARVGLAGTLAANASGLETLQRAQLTRIPFENFDILLGREISLEPAQLFDKLVRHARGGYCFELNGLLAQALEALSYRPRACLARVIFGRGSPGSRTHQVIVVHANGRDWLVDAGFGGPGLRAPLLLETDREALQDGDRFRLHLDEQFGYILQKSIDGVWADLYAFDLLPALPHDFYMANFFMSHWPQSYFRLNRVASLQRPRGRRTLLNFTLREEDDGRLSRRELQPGAGYMTALMECFGIELDAGYTDLLPAGT